MQGSPSPSDSSSQLPAPEFVRKRKCRHGESELSLSQTDDSEEDIVTKSMKKDTDPIKSKGRIFGCIGKMWQPFSSILGDSVSWDVDDNRQAYTAIQNIHFDIYRELVKIAPVIPNEVRHPGAHGSATISAKLEAGQHASRSEDINSMKDKIGRWRTFAPPYDPDNQLMLCFKHPDCGKLLCPHTETTCSVRANLRNGITKVRPNDFPLFLYMNEQVDSEDLFHGFLHNMILVKGYLHVFRGPSAAMNSLQSGTRKGNAATHSITKVTVPVIAYIAMLIHFVLSDQPTFSAGGSSGHWPYRTFYHTLLEVVSVMNPHEREDLLNWWNDKIYADFVDLEENNGELSIVARMKAQATGTVISVTMTSMAPQPRPTAAAIDRSDGEDLSSVGTS
ncbi:hypothetical protein EDD22DRAFT_959371 [Suillus occidentalis]|nr:hypothetical protein EDD22DRAFT_959371 [Suillus occidentalis]